MSQGKDGREEEARMEAAEQTGEELPERWSARAKTEIVLRLLKGEELGTVSREAQVPVHELERWRRIFLEGGTNGFKRRDTPGAERELKRVQAKVGELTMKLEIVEWFLEKKTVWRGRAVHLLDEKLPACLPWRAGRSGRRLFGVPRTRKKTWSGRG